MRRFCAILAGMVFFCAGLFKLTDPLGTSITVTQYLDFFHLSFLDWSAFGIGELLSLLELLTGLALLMGVFKKLTARVAIVLTAFFTLLTLIILIFSPSDDCGCMGEAVELSSFATFIKNLVLCGLVAGACLPFSALKPGSAGQRAAFYCLGGIGLLLGIYSMFFLPLWDFTSFAPGNRLVSLQDPGNMISEPAFIYSKDGEERSFSLHNLPDSTWTFERQETIEYLDFSTPENYIPIRLEDGDSADSLLLKGKVLVMSLYKPRALSALDWEFICQFFNESLPEDVNPLILHSYIPREDIPVADTYIYSSDGSALRSLVRSNGGLVYVNDGMIVDKWAWAMKPSAKRIQEITAAHPGSVAAKNAIPGRIILILYIILPLLISFYIDKKGQKVVQQEKSLS